ncbi:MAG: AlpA family phage regulatory protein [Pseudomonadota bacterium]|nr:AlpA family phage regulatory protein [Pseudomonadota bacterium]
MALILRLHQVISETGLSRSSIYRQIQAGKFPPPIKISDRSSGWDFNEIQRWKEIRTNREPWGVKQL